MKSFGLTASFTPPNLDINSWRKKVSQSEGMIANFHSTLVWVEWAQLHLRKKVRSFAADFLNNLICKWWAVWWRNFYGKAIISFCYRSALRIAGRRKKKSNNVDGEKWKNKYGCRESCEKGKWLCVCVRLVGEEGKGKSFFCLRNILQKRKTFGTCVWGWNANQWITYILRYFERRENNGVKEFSHFRIEGSRKNGKINEIFWYCFHSRLFISIETIKLKLCNRNKNQAVRREANLICFLFHFKQWH